MRREIDVSLDWVGPVLAVLTIPVALASCAISGNSLARGELDGHGTSNLVALLVVGTFTLILVASLVINASVILIKRFTGGGKHLPRPLVPLQLALAACIGVWLWCLTDGNNELSLFGYSATVIAAFAIAVLSMFVFLFVAVPWRRRFGTPGLRRGDRTP